ncbi:MAG: branched-chain amino acid ABC transporter permease [Deltaproteobacteria bacterium]|nr:branched-chain amino acid ABC transporter permease [Deltaproteobacteria bacterium]
MDRRTKLALVALAALAVYPFVPALDLAVQAVTGEALRLDRQLVNIAIFAILALALNLQVGYAGLLQLGIAAFFAIGAYTTGILTVGKYPFQLELWGALALAPVTAGLAGLALGAPTLRLRGDYLAIVTLGFAEVVRVLLINLEGITDGPRGLNPIPEPWLPAALRSVIDTSADASRARFLAMYFLALGSVAALFVGFRTLERSKLGRAFVALREDELASACMGVNPTRTKLIAFALGAAMAGYAGALYACNLTTTAEPNTYDFNYSIMVLCCIIIGGLGSLRGATLGAAVLLGFDNVVSPLLTKLLQRLASGDSNNVLLSFSNWRWLIFGTALVLMMRFRPGGLWPSERVAAELEEGHR